MATIKPVLVKAKKKKDGTIPIAIRISENNRSTYHFLNKYISEKDWDERSMRVRKSHPIHDALNTLISLRKTELEKKITLAEINPGDKSILDVVKKTAQKQWRSKFFELAEDHLKELEDSQKINRLISDKGRLNQIIMDLGDRK